MNNIKLNAKLLKMLQKHGVKRFKSADLEVEFHEDFEIQQPKPLGLPSLKDIPFNQQPTASELLFWSADGGDANPKDDNPDETINKEAANG